MSLTMSVWRTLLVAVAAALFLAGSASASFIIRTTDDDNGADTHISNDSHQSQGTNHGSAASNSVRAILNSRAKVGMLRFDVSGLSHPYEDVQLQLELTFAKRARTWHIYGLNDDGLDSASTADNWGEGTITFAGAPGIDQAASGVNTGNYVLDIGTDPGQVTHLTTMDVDTPLTTYTSVISTAFDDFINAAIANPDNGLVTLYISYDGGQSSTDSNPDWSFAAKEHTTATAPTLLAVPEPSSIALAMVGLAAVGFGFRRRR